MTKLNPELVTQKATAKINNMINRLCKKHVTYQDKALALFESYPINKQLSLLYVHDKSGDLVENTDKLNSVTISTFIELFRMFTIAEETVKVETITRAFRNARTRTKRKLDNQVKQITDRWQHSDYFDNLSYCIYDCMPETRYDNDLFEFLYVMVEQVIKNHSVTKVA